MITNKDIRVEAGNLVLNGDKYPLDGQSPEAIMSIVEDNSDSTPTEESTAPVQSGGVYSALDDITDIIGDITQTGVTGATVAAQLNTIDTDLDNSVKKLSGNYSTTLYTDFDDLPHGSIVQLLGSAAHAPGSAAHYYIVFTYFVAATTNYKMQFAIENENGNLYTRNCSNGTWGSWNKFAKTT